MGTTATAVDRYTDKTFSQLESRISKMYKEAQKDLRKKLDDFTRHHRTKDAEMRRKLKAGEITQAQYQQWMIGQVFVGNQWKQKVEQINNSIKGVMQNASDLTHGKSMDVFAENANYTAYQLEKDLKANINFDLYDTTTVSRLVGKDPEILPRRVVNGRKLEAWETKKISNAISQGIIQGEGIDQIANRIARDTCIAADQSSVMYARTAMTCAQNAGRLERLHEAEEMGIKVKKRWMATLDDRTRDTHRDLDGETVDVDEKFSNGLMHPGDSSTNDFAEICNCRCTMVYVYPEFKQSASLGYDEEGHKQYETVGDITYKQWATSKKTDKNLVDDHEERQEHVAQREPEEFRIPDSVRDMVDAESASEDWFEYEYADLMKKYSQTGIMPTEDMNHMEVSDEVRQRLAAEAELMQKEGENTKTKYKILYRGLVMDEKDIMSSYTRGEEVIIDSLTATSPDKTIASIYTNVENRGGEGVPVIFEFEKPDGIYGFKRDDLETVLPKGSEFKVSRKWVDEDGIIHVTLYSKKGKNVR